MNPTTLTLEGDRVIKMARTFNGPAHIVFDAWTKPELVQRWWAPRSIGVTMISCEADIRVGGSYRYVFSARGGQPMAFKGEYREIKRPTRLVHTELFEPVAGGPNIDDNPIVATVTFDERDGKTHVVSTLVCPSKDARDGMLQSGMEKGAREAWDQLDALVESLA